MISGDAHQGIPKYQYPVHEEVPLFVRVNIKIAGHHENNPTLQVRPQFLSLGSHPSFQSGCILKQGSARFWHDNGRDNTFSPQKNAVPFRPLQHHLPSISYMKICNPIRQKIRTDLKLQRWRNRQDAQNPSDPTDRRDFKSTFPKLEVEQLMYAF
jgi:hypothetical protein